MVLRLVVGVVAGSNTCCNDLGLQRLQLQGVEEAAPGIAARSLPARDHSAGIVVELAADPGVKAEAGQAALHVAALAPVETDLVFAGLVGFLGEGCGIDTGGQVTGRGRGAILQRGDAGERQRLERAVRIVGEIGVEFFRLVRVLDRAPELKLDFRGRTGSGRRRVRRFDRSTRRGGSRIEIH